MVDAFSTMFTQDQVFLRTLQVLFAIIPFFLIYRVTKALWGEWLGYIQGEFFEKEGAILLQIRLPKDQTKTPAAMELMLTGLKQDGGESTWIDKYWKGKTRSWFSLEIVSLSGQVYFFIWTRPSVKAIIEAQVYAQYPSAEVVEAEDYMDDLDLSSGKYELMGFEMGLTKPDPYPIKTYVEYGLDKAGEDEEYKVDPLTPLLEFMGGIQQDHNILIQILVRSHKAETRSFADTVIWKPWTWFGKSVDSWKDDAIAEVKKIKESVAPKKEDGTPDTSKPLSLTEGQKDTIKALEASTGKYAFDIGMRTIYIAKKDIFEGSNIPGMVGGLKQFGSESHNGFKPVWKTKFDYPWEDVTGRRSEKRKEIIFDAYKARGFFYRPWLLVGSGKLLPGGSYERKPFILNTEELATIYHFPGQVAQTPTFGRLNSRKGEAPSNLPI